ncbi:MAG: ABC-F family ATP-binding cassette domain-containing protein [Candidatus Sumerlaeota bacterium]|nr:ABC-F family ATP-binding cassette domain-containing protein [Candidatus Sumerlaeota bacterium]
MNILSAQSLEKAFGEKRLFQQVTLGIEERDRLGLIGLNGCGKSTLLKVLAGVEQADSGVISYRQDLRIEYLPQNPVFNDNHTVLEHILTSNTERAALVRDYEQTCLALETHPGDPAAMRNLDLLSQRMNAADAWEYETWVKTVLSKLNVHDLDKPVGQLSGGYRKRVALAHALLAESDLLLLDEPTNHLDADTIEWLEEYLKLFSGAVVLVTHDRYFLDRIAKRILEMDRREVVQYDGAFSYYLEKKAEIQASQQRQEEKRSGVLRREMEWLKRGARARTTKQKARVERIAALRETKSEPRREALLFSIETRRMGGLILEIEGLSKSYGDRTIIKNYSHVFQKGERLGILGPNGCGKTTLVNLIAGRIKPDRGTIKTGETVVFGYYDQESAELDLDERVIDYAKREGGAYLRGRDGSLQAAEFVLEQFYFTSQNLYTPVGKLSGGEKRRLYLVRTLLKDPNFLILDEPTNDLDIQTLQALEDFLDGFNGCLLVISHDRYFLDRTVNHVLVFEPDGKLRRYPGGYSVYARMREEERTAPAERSGSASGKKFLGAKTASALDSSKTGGPRTLNFKEKRELAALEKEIPKMEARQAQLQKELGAAASDYARLLTLLEEQGELAKNIEKALNRWEELASQAE